jgi:hypothetical protein
MSGHTSFKIDIRPLFNWRARAMLTARVPLASRP